MPDFGTYCFNASPIRAAVFAHYRARGVTSESKMAALWWRWVKAKGYRFPETQKRQTPNPKPARVRALGVDIRGICEPTRFLKTQK